MKQRVMSVHCNQRLMTSRYTISKHKCTHKVACVRVVYHDDPIVDDMFYITYIGRYHNKHHFIAGTTTDITATQFMATHIFPIHKCVYKTPIGRYIDASNKLHDFTRDMRLSVSPVQGFHLAKDFDDPKCWMICMEEYDGIDDIIKKADAVFDVRSRFEIE